MAGFFDKVGSAIGGAFTGEGSIFRGSRPGVLGTDIIGVPGELGGFGAGAYGPFRIPAKYYLEIRDGDNFTYMTCLPYDPMFVDIQRQTPTMMTQTLGGTMREFAPQRRHKIILKGRSGTNVRTAYNRHGGVMYQDGNTVFKEFDEFLKQYNEVQSLMFSLTSDNLSMSLPASNMQGFSNSIHGLGSKHPNGRYMVLRCIDEDAHFKVEPVSFQYSRASDTNRFDYIYTLVLEAYDYAYDSKTYNPIMGVIDAIDNVVGLAGGAIGLATNVINNVSNDYVRGVGDAISNIATIVDAFDDLAGSFGNLADSIAYTTTAFCNTVDRFATFGDSWVEMSNHWQFDSAQHVLRSFELDDEVAELNDQTAELDNTSREVVVIEQYTYAVEGPDNVDEETALLLSNLQALENRVKNAGKITRGSISKKFFEDYSRDGRDYNPGEFLSNEKNLEILSVLHNDRNATVGQEGAGSVSGLTVVLQRDEDLKKVALKYLGSSDYAYDLVIANGWIDERRRPDGLYAQSGDTIIIPSTLTSNINPFSENGPIGGDIYMPFDDLEFDLLRSDFVITSRQQTLNNVLKNIILTAEGEVPLNKKLGVPQIIMSNFDPAITGILIRDSIVAHPYFVDVQDIVTEVDDDTLYVECKVICIDGTEIPVRTHGENMR